MTVVNKLGGSCLRSAEDYLKVDQIITSTPCILVVSASKGTTDVLLECLRLAATGKNYLTKLHQLITFHQSLNNKITDDAQIQILLLKDKEDIVSLLHSVSLLGAYSEEQKNWLLGYGEYWSSKIIAAMLAAPWIDLGQIITVDFHEGLINIDWVETKKRLHRLMKGVDAPIVVMPGFVARTHQGLRALLGFNGTDFSAAIIARLVMAERLYKWTDIDGIFTADPKWVKSAFAIPDLSYQEASELAYFGATVLHPQSVQPAIEANIPIHIKNFFKLNSPGTIISSSSECSEYLIKGLSSISDLALINIEGTGLAGLCGVAGRLFQSLAKGNISVILISQASSEHSISIVVNGAHGSHAVKLIQYEFIFELAHGVVQSVDLIEHCSVVSAVGDQMSGTPGVAAKYFEMLSKANINVLAIAQGSSERNISAVIKTEQTQKALRVLHGGFYLSSKTLSIGLIGPGGVGAALLSQIKKNRARLKREINVDLKVRGLMNSQNMIIHEQSIDLKDWEEQLKSNSVPKNLIEFVTHIASPEIPHAVIVDCTSSAEIASQYPRFIEFGCHVVTPNKKANSSDLQNYKQLKDVIKSNNRHYLYETTVCAGLPILKTIQDLLATGDSIKRIEGIVSGTLSFIFHQCAKGLSFADSVIQAYELGYTEPDPREDLNGLDVARKFVCLARELGYDLVLEDVKLLDMVPNALKNVSIPDFLKNLVHHQKTIEDKIKRLLKNNAALAYVGIIEHGKISIQLNAYPASHPFANTTGTDNILLIQSRRYNKQPLIIQGPGAGKYVTAAGVFADLLKLASML
ncbi:bifunctional aspartate kinase/homoserine dehydrogenase I [Legionella quateirensis]|uniref:Bifunctional aspartokinase/homoserine dehydrogenase n=1 Tax=Legionella quateirensis TaxID=45072 RepID=A0A378KVV6_9GAMM|nr:bifunctional aspartate kinase/homoserine dehydrogenase I [Legionella quateirensis]KTD51033.1 bifunctional aspartate kinase/diaminopimelate decarboxylase protein [Legionella quateirensis]STY17721.1 aspartokinase [Legionella quateirensis]